MTRTSKPPVKAVRDDEIRALLDRYRCPVPFHMVRTRFLGNIASPIMSASPLDTLKGLWGGELPSAAAGFGGSSDSPLEGDGFELSVPRERGHRFELYGLFGKEESLELPERARRAVTALSEMRAMLEGVHVVARDPTKPATFDDIAQALGNVRELTRISEREIHEAVLSCTRARRQTLHSMPTAKPTLH